MMVHVPQALNAASDANVGGTSSPNRLPSTEFVGADTVLPRKVPMMEKILQLTLPIAAIIGLWAIFALPWGVPV